jgi:HlyD family secretion protein
MKRRTVIFASAAALLIALVWVASAWIGHRSRFEYSGTVETREIQIGSKVGGRVTEVPVEEGQVV